MNGFFFVPSALRLLSRGTFFRKLFFYFFRASAALTALVGLVLCTGLLKLVINLPAVGVIGGFIFIALTIVAFYAAAHIYWVRAENIKDLAETKFTMIPIYAITLRTVGEVLASFIALISVGGFILLLFAPQQASGMLSGILPMGPLSMLMEQGGNSFIEALVILVGGSIYAVLLLALFYLLAEFISALAEIAINTGMTATNTAMKFPSPGMPLSITIPTPIASAPVETADKLCGSCGTPNPLGSMFCENCGKSV